MQTNLEKNLLATKAELLCWGVRLEGKSLTEALKKYPYLLEEKYIHGAHLMLDGGILVNACFSEDFVSRSPYKIEDQYGGFLLFKNDQPVCTCDVISAPRWYEKKIDENFKMADVLRQHGFDVLADANYVKCDFVVAGEQCMFCSFPHSRISEEQKIKLIKNVVSVATRENHNYSVWLSEGTRSTPDRGAVYLSKIVREIRKSNKEIPISVELAPPERNEFIDTLIDSGATSVIMNLELYDDSLRKKFCPCKSKIPSERYLSAWSYSLDILGEGAVGSVLIAGLEEGESTVRCAEMMISKGVIPTVVPFRPYDNCGLRSLPTTSPDMFLRVSEKIGKMLRESGLCKKMQRGCISCGGCSLEIEYV